MISLAAGHCFSAIYHSRSYTNLRWKVSCCSEMSGSQKTVWLWTQSKDVMTTSVERGWDTFIFTPETESLVNEWKSIVKIQPYFWRNGELLDEENKEVAVFGEVSCAEDLESLKSLAEKNDIVVMDAKEWQMISAENMIAFFQNSQALIYALSRTASEAQLFFESLEKGTDGIVLKTEDTNEVILLKEYVDSQTQKKMKLTSAVVKRVELMGMGDRVCVDLCSLLVPGQGLLVGSFARGLFLVHSECLQSNYVASRPFRVNAGSVHAYVALPGGRTSYLAELKSGMEVLVVDVYGRQRISTVGRVKIETRPLILVEAVGEDEPTTYSLLLQNAETVNLVCPPPAGNEVKTILTVPVTSIKPGDRVLLSIQESARHTGIAINEFIIEK